MQIRAAICSRQTFTTSLWIIVSAFIIKHFSDPVEYTSDGFLEKNRDTISKELVSVLRDSDMPICRKLMALGEQSQQPANDSLGGRVKINASKQLVRRLIRLPFIGLVFHIRALNDMHFIVCFFYVLTHVSIRFCFHFIMNPIVFR